MNIRRLTIAWQLPTWGYIGYWFFSYWYIGAVGVRVCGLSVSWRHPWFEG